MMKRDIEWPDGKKMCATLTVAFEAFKKSGRFKYEKGLKVNLASISHANYGGNVGVWRTMEVLQRHNMVATIDFNADALRKWPEAAKALHQAGHEMTGHGVSNDTHMYELPPDGQRAEVRECLDICEEITGYRPVGWVGPGGLHTLETLGILAEEGIQWCGDQCDDDLPYVVDVDGRRICIIPKVFYANDFRAWEGGLGSGDSFFEGFKEAFDYTYQECLRGRPGRMDALIHVELGARPHLMSGFERMLQYMNQFQDDLWMPNRRDIARYCLDNLKAEPYQPFG
jgi:peptidoglycan/xylan/chitin deacetylase (PgdA/CDA1 family)